MDYIENYKIQKELNDSKTLLTRYKNLVEMVIDELSEHIEDIKPIVEKSLFSEIEDLKNELISFNIKYS